MLLQSGLRKITKMKVLNMAGNMLDAENMALPTSNALITNLQSY
jgi:hypothetical protein